MKGFVFAATRRSPRIAALRSLARRRKDFSTSMTTSLSLLSRNVESGIQRIKIFLN